MSYKARPAVAEITGARRPLTVVDDFGTVDALKVDAGDPQVGVTELALDDDHRDALMDHFHSVRMPELVGREAPPDPGTERESAQLLARCGRFPRASGARAVDHANEHPNRQLSADLQPRAELFPSPAIHPDLSALAALA